MGESVAGAAGCFSQFEKELEFRRWWVDMDPLKLWYLAPTGRMRYSQGGDPLFGSRRGTNLPFGPRSVA
jgi:hypothetical protein